MKLSLRPADVFAGANFLLFLFMCWAVYYDRLVEYRGAGNVYEFFLYACAILAAIALVWWFCRRLPFPAWVLGLIQIGILLHFSGAFFPIEGGRLYDSYALGFRFDKYVHAFNCFAGAALVCHIFDTLGARVPLYPAVIILGVLGCGALVEIIEYGVFLTVAHNGVGNYDNNMQDLLANLVGASLFMAVRRPAASLVDMLRTARQ